MTADLHELYVECFGEVRKQFSGSKPHVLKEMADRLFEEARPDIPRRSMAENERELRLIDFGTCLQTIPEIRGIKPGDRRLDNAK